ncbi:hypothetical protein HMPREF2615_09180 [Pseudomonas aeruginosa]|nr:hypothetical protein HMPREF2615_09180 [Pseudomonas aeruginosa]
MLHQLVGFLLGLSFESRMPIGRAIAILDFDHEVECLSLSVHRLALQGVLTSSMPLLRRAPEEISKPLLCVLIHFAFPAIQLYEPLGFIVFVDPVECRKN